MNNQNTLVQTPENYLCILVLQDRLIAYNSMQSGVWKLIKIQGSEYYLHKDNAQSLNVTVDDLSAYLNLKDKLAKVKISLIYQHGKDHLLSNIVKTLQDYQCKNWQIINWESIYQYALQVLNIESLSLDPQNLEAHWIQDHILPLVWHENSIEHQKNALAALRSEKQIMQEQLSLMQSNAEHALVQQVNKLEREKQELQQYITEAKGQLQKLQQPNLESLLVFLPVIFKDFWNIVRPDELSLIVGVINAPNIPSPYHSPNLSTIQQKKRQFIALSEDSQHKILGLCRELIHNHNTLQVHQEFKVLVGELN